MNAIARTVSAWTLVAVAAAAQILPFPEAPPEPPWTFDVFAEFQIEDRSAVAPAGGAVLLHAYAPVAGVAYVGVSVSVNWGVFAAEEAIVFAVPAPAGHLLIETEAPKALAGLAFVVQAALAAEDGTFAVAAPTNLLILPTDYDLDVVMPATFGFIDAPRRSYPL